MYVSRGSMSYFVVNGISISYFLSLSFLLFRIIILFSTRSTSYYTVTPAAITVRSPYIRAPAGFGCSVGTPTWNSRLYAESAFFRTLKKRYEQNAGTRFPATKTKTTAVLHTSRIISATTSYTFARLIFLRSHGRLLMGDGWVVLP